MVLFIMLSLTIFDIQPLLISFNFLKQEQLIGDCSPPKENNAKRKSNNFLPLGVEKGPFGSETDVEKQPLWHWPPGTKSSAEKSTFHP